MELCRAAPVSRAVEASWSRRRRCAASSPTRGFERLVPWTRGVDTALFRPGSRRGRVAAAGLPLCRRVAVEKNLPAFLDLDLPGSKLVVGDGPSLAAMRRRYPESISPAQSGEALVRHYASADVMVMPSRTETFGLVLLEALACGVPVAAFPVFGPTDVIGDSGAGIIDEDLRAPPWRADDPARALPLHAQRFSWQASIDQFLSHVVPVGNPSGNHCYAERARYAGLVQRPLDRLLSDPPPALQWCQRLPLFRCGWTAFALALSGGEARLDRSAAPAGRAARQIWTTPAPKPISTPICQARS